MMLYCFLQSLALQNGTQYDKHDSDFFDAHDFEIDEKGKKYR